MQATKHAMDVSGDVRGFPRTGADSAANRARNLELVRTSQADAAASFEGGELLHARERTLLSAIQDRTTVFTTAGQRARLRLELEPMMA